MILKFDIKEVLLILKREVVEAFNQSSWLTLFTAIAILSVPIGPLPHIPYVQVPFILLYIIMNIGRHWTVNKACVLFLFYLPLNIIIANPDPVFKSWERMAFFLIVFILASPLFQGEYVANIRKKILHGALLVTTIVSLGSFFCYFLGINYMTSQANGGALTMDQYMGSAGAFGGLTKQSIVLGLFCGVSSLYLFYRSTIISKEKRFVLWCCVFLVLITILFSASRSALLSAVAGLLVMLYYQFESKAGFIKTLLVIVISAMLTFPLWEGATEGMTKKQEANNKIEGNYGSRTGKWIARMEEFSLSPVFGVGFSAQDPNGSDNYDKRSGTVEPGSSWLCILSMTGVLGLILVLSIIAPAFFYLRDNPTPYNGLLLGLYTFFCVAFISEGYVYAGGSPLCFFSWLVFGCANDAREGFFEGEDVEMDEDDE